jgi:two-component system chemotaxis sensor kinase CheA
MATNKKRNAISKTKRQTKSRSSNRQQHAAPAPVQTPAIQNLKVDDAVALLLQLEPENVHELGQVRAVIEQLAASFSDTQRSHAELRHAIEALDRIISSSSADPLSDFNRAMACLEAACRADEAQTQGFEQEVFREQEPQKEERIAEPAVGPFELPADADRELIGEFVAEGKDLVEAAEAALLSLETEPENMGSVNTVFRTFHTIKGTSAFLGLPSISEFAHRGESLLSRVRDREIRFGGVYADLALRSTDILKELLRGVQELLDGKSATLPAGYDEVLRMLEKPDALAAEEILQDMPDEPLVDDASAFHELPPREQVNQVASEAVEISNTVPVPPAGNLRSQTQDSSGGGGAHSSLRVRTDRLDRLIDMVGELVIAESMVSQDEIVHQPINHDLLRKVTHAGKIVRELQDLAMAMRMVPLKGVFQKVTRLVRDLAHRSGKAIDFIAQGEETEIDRNMVDILSDPIVHMIRNAIDHGIEPPEVRAALGKPQTGVIRLAAYHSGGNVVLELQDDGRGLDREKIVERAINKGLIESDRKLSDVEVLRLIFLPGFSTSDQVTEISGRGVGMDVVKQSVEALHGYIDLASELGKGCTFFVRLPLTLAITDGMLVKVGGERYIIPTLNIHLSFRPEKSSLWTVAGRGEMVMLRGELMPVFRLHRLFGIDNAVSDPTRGLLVVVGEGIQRCALLVDELLGQQQVVAKSLGKGMKKVQGIAGGAILGDGRVGLIIDAPEIISLARRVSNDSNLSGSNSLNAA